MGVWGKNADSVCAGSRKAAGDKIGAPDSSNGPLQSSSILQVHFLPYITAATLTGPTLVFAPSSDCICMQLSAHV